jgi:predicted  nucleic acid-binding Zn-ribbon protein
MNAGRDLTEAYQEWRRLAEAEGEAIGAGDWRRLSACQQELQRLQTRITPLTPSAREEWSRSEVGRTARERVKAAIRELLELHGRNQARLREKMEATRAQLDQLRQAGRNLKQIQRSYVFNRPARWTSFS